VKKKVSFFVWSTMGIRLVQCIRLCITSSFVLV
jgi:heme exporter protein D